MRNSIYYLTIGVIGLLMTACVAAPETESVIRSTSTSQNASDTASTEAIKQREEQRYARLLTQLQRRNAVQEARAAITHGDYHVMGYYAGRGGLKIPGMNASQNRCVVQQQDGMGDILYGDNHLSYRVALRRFSNQFNQVMLPYCR